MKCSYEMIPNGWVVPAWDCQLEEGHVDQYGRPSWHNGHYPGETSLEWQHRQRMAYLLRKQKPHKEEDETIVLATGEVTLSEVVKMNAKGQINKQSIMGKAADLLLHSPLELKAGKSVYREGEKDGTLVWLEARGHGVHVKVSPSKTTTYVYWNSDRIDIPELERRIEDYRDAQERG